MFVTSTSASAEQPPAKIKYLAHKVKVKSKVRKANKLKLKMAMPESEEIVSENSTNQVRWKGFKVSIKSNAEQIIDALHSEKKHHTKQLNSIRPSKTVIIGRVG
ncbi:MAG: hypothetical protein NZM38_10155 [Cytophagales bacterium]|nr:hypothetical protein [Cytophagales bacterium]MDW8385117.1 hypothetical protein [Flammeovirgaceae bacterium]